MASQHKNIVLLIADLGQYIGSHGCASISTPNLDRLAASGTQFTNAFASTASCSGNRSTIFTGLHTHQNGQYGLNRFKSHFQTFQQIDSAPKLFNQAGYKTGIIGKVHVGPDEVYSWQYGPRVPLLEVKPEHVEVQRWLTDLPETRQELAEYYKAVNRTDTGVGLVYDALKRQGLLDNTLVIFTSDNGPPFVNSKTTLYDTGIKLPLIVRQPSGKSGIVNPNMISFVDILPTLLDWAELPLDLRSSDRDSSSPASPARQGRSFLTVLERADLLPDSDWQHHIFGSHTFHEMQNYWPTRILRTRRYKYHRNVVWRLDFPFAADLYANITFDGIRNMDPPVMLGKRALKDYVFRPPEELYDLEHDADEVKNLAGEKEHEGRLLEFRERVTEWQKLTKDLWLYRDGQSLTVNSRYAKDGLQIPERLDFDVNSPGTKDVVMMKHLTVDGYSAGIEK
ncbi:hypothetical protein LTR42_009094 [Elasticomyces elasticus]|nr:hypothetical protein LTR42_009094 [Elasticomyces elasticus]